MTALKKSSVTYHSTTRKTVILGQRDEKDEKKKVSFVYQASFGTIPRNILNDYPDIGNRKRNDCNLDKTHIYKVMF